MTQTAIDLTADSSKGRGTASNRAGRTASRYALTSGDALPEECPGSYAQVLAQARMAARARQSAVHLYIADRSRSGKWTPLVSVGRAGEVTVIFTLPRKKPFLRAPTQDELIEDKLREGTTANSAGQMPRLPSLAETERLWAVNGGAARRAWLRMLRGADR